MTIDKVTNDTKSYSVRPWLKQYDYWVRPEMNYPRRSLYEILRRTAIEYPERTATIFLGAELTFWEIKEQADKFATVLHGFGIKKGDRIGIMLPNCPQYLIATFAVWKLGAIIVNINPLYTPRELGFVVKDSGLRVLVTLDLVSPIVLEVKKELAIEKIILTSAVEYSASTQSTKRIPGTENLSDLLAEVGTINLPKLELDVENDVAVLQYTGGTTGEPKAAMLTHYNLFANLIQTANWGQELLSRGNETFLLVIPLFHVYGFSVGMLHAIWLGARQILIPKYDVEALLNAVKNYSPSYFPAVPTIFISLLNNPQAQESGIGRVRLFNSGSAPLPVEVIDQFDRLTNGAINEGYGLSEASPVTHSTPYLMPYKPGSIGLPYPDTEVKIVDLKTGENEVAAGQEGELCISGPQVMKGYWNRPDETANTLRVDKNGRKWLYTGDIARMDEEGFFYIVQRKKDMIIVGGFNVYPSEVESVLYSHSEVLEAAVIGVNDNYRGETVKAFVVLKSEAIVTPDELIEHCKKELVIYKVPKSVEIRKSLPKTPVGKILHRVLREEIIIEK